MTRTRQAPPPAGVLRSLELGDEWSYEASGTVTPPGGGASAALNGTIAVSVLPDTLSDSSDGFMLAFVQRLQVKNSDGVIQEFPAPDLMFSFVQDPATKDASIVADNLGQNGACRRAEAPQVFYPGRWSPGTHYANRLMFGGGDFVRNTLFVMGQERVETPAGAFSSWVAAITSESPAMGRITGVDWWTPELGAPARFETNATMPDGATMRLLATLSSTSVSLNR